MDWTNIEAPSLDEIEKLARVEFETLPAQFRSLCGDILFMVQEFPDDDVIKDMDLDSEFDILGLFQGSTLADRVGHGGQQGEVGMAQLVAIDQAADRVVLGVDRGEPCLRLRPDLYGGLCLEEKWRWDDDSSS